MIKNYILSILFLGLSLLGYAQCVPADVFANTTTNSVCTETDSAVRYYYSNSLPDHSTGMFPNPGNPHTISAQQLTLTMCLNPEALGSNTDLDQGTTNCVFWEFGVGSNGLIFDPIAAEYFENPSTGQLNMDWNLNATSSLNSLGLDFNDSHVQPTGKYHYHGFPSSLETAFGVVSGSHSPIVGYAADGYPIYGKYLYTDANDNTSAITEIVSSYQLKSGMRPGDGTTAPDGAYDGQYTQDYEYVAGLGDLDECNGRTGVTPEFPSGTYYYVLTTDFPNIPRCFKGNPDTSFTIGAPGNGCGISNAGSICSTLSVDENVVDANDVILYPNPTQERIKINNSLISKNVHIFNAEGKNVFSGEFIDNELDISHLQAGVYYIQLQYNRDSFIKKIIKN